MTEPAEFRLLYLLRHGGGKLCVRYVACSWNLTTGRQGRPDIRWERRVLQLKKPFGATAGTEKIKDRVRAQPKRGSSFQPGVDLQVSRAGEML